MQGCVARNFWRPAKPHGVHFIAARTLLVSLGTLLNRWPKRRHHDGFTPASLRNLVPRFRGMEGSFSAIFPTGSGGLTPPFHGIGVLVILVTQVDCRQLHARCSAGGRIPPPTVVQSTGAATRSPHKQTAAVRN